ncbi:MAG: hypothetical protein ACK4ND_06135 [Cytophagaceae bacterium]
MNKEILNNLELELAILEGAEQVEYKNIIYSNCAFIKLIVDGIDLIKETEDRKSVINWGELIKTKFDSGNFLLLTCMCGDATDGGFKKVKVERNEDTVKWTFNDNSNIIWTFDINKYDKAISRMEHELETLTVKLEPFDP